MTTLSIHRPIELPTHLIQSTVHHLTHTHISVPFNFSSLLLSVIFLPLLFVPYHAHPILCVAPNALEKMMKIHLSKHHTDFRAYLCLIRTMKQEAGNAIS